jgi:hypothetical protein
VGGAGPVLRPFRDATSLSITTFSITTFSITFSITTFCITTFSITTFTKLDLLATLSKSGSLHKGRLLEFGLAILRVAFLKSNVVMLSVVVPFQALHSGEPMPCTEIRE